MTQGKVESHNPIFNVELRAREVATNLQLNKTFRWLLAHTEGAMKIKNNTQLLSCSISRSP